MEKALIVRTPLEVEQSIKQMIAVPERRDCPTAKPTGRPYRPSSSVKARHQTVADNSGYRYADGSTHMRLIPQQKLHFGSTDGSICRIGAENARIGTAKGAGDVIQKRFGSIACVLYLPAVVSKKYNPDIAAQYARLLQRQKTPMQALGAAMRKLVHICFGVLKHQTVYQSRQLEISATGA
ncbi:hypothetical protein [Conchiformibius kuhniae]